MEASRILGGQPLLGCASPVFTGISRDSRRLRPGDLFITAGGDEPAHLAAAERAGAVAVLGEDPGAGSLPQLRTPHARWSFAKASSVANGLDRACPPLLGVTGTKGKTTTACATWWCLGAGAGRIGTVGWHDGTREWPSAQTTPPPEEIHAFLAGLPATCPGVAIEVSSHAGDQHRLAGLELAGLVFTGLERDHLDYHGTVADYLAAKLEILRLLKPGAPCVLNADDPRYAVVAHAARVAGADPIGLGFIRGQARLHRDGGAWRLGWEGADHPVPATTPGWFNIFNAAAGALLAGAVGVPLASALARLASQPSVPGRLERCAIDPITYVDYAHTAQSLALLIEALREEHPGRRLVCVFGCGGDRDRGKRGPMGRAAITADLAVLTNDNSRTEDPSAIAAEVISGLPTGACTHWDAGTAMPPPGAHLVVQLDRASAIRLARRLAGPDGVVVVAGKGHETTQTIGVRSEPWDDRTFIRRLEGTS